LTGEERWNAALGCRTDEVALALLADVTRVLAPTVSDAMTEDEIDTLLQTATALLAELEPKTASESMLAAQMIGTHHAAMHFLRRGRSEEQQVEVVDRNVNRATRLMCQFTEQVEAMSKLKGKSGQQRVIVEHVTVNQGGQAIVGAVTATKTVRGDPGGMMPSSDNPMNVDHARTRVRPIHPPSGLSTKSPRILSKTYVNDPRGADCPVRPIA
jgi:hypothetical protein